MTSIKSFHDFTKDVGAFALQLRRQRVDVDARLAEFGQHLLAVAAVGRHHAADLAMVGEGQQRALGHGVDGVRSRQGLDVQDVGRLRILGARAGQQQTLRIVRPWRRWPSSEAMPADRDRPCKYAWRSQCPACRAGSRALFGDGNVPAADEHRGHGTDIGVEPGSDAPLDAAQVGLGCSQILLAREQQRHIDRDAGEDGLLDGRQAFLGVPGILMNRFGRAARACRSLAAAMVVAVS